MTALAPEPGDLIADKYRLEKQLGRGGMGAVFLAMDTHLERRVAIKILLEEHAEDQGAVLRFLREARASVKIQSEHVAHVYETGKLPSGVPYIVMEYLLGQDLAERLESEGRLDAGQIASWVMQACEALAEAHAAGIVHRDLKPANLFLAQRPDGGSVLKILDFGISKISTSSVLTKSQTLVGSPYYMSPEQLESAQDVDQRADIWALGVIMYELYAGRRPFEGDSLAALCVSVLNATPEPLSDSTDQAFCEVVTKCLRKERKQRYQNVGELAQALEALRPQESHGAAARVTKVLQNARTVPDMPRPESDAAPERSASWAQTNREVSARRRTTKRFVLAVAVLAGAAFVGIGLGRLARAPLAEGTALGNAPSAEPAIGLAESLTSSQPEPANSTEVSPAVAEAVEVPTGTASASSSASSVPAAPNGPALHKVTAAKQNPPAAASANGPGEAPRFKALAPKPPPESKPGNDPARDPFLRRY